MCKKWSSNWSILDFFKDAKTVPYFMYYSEDVLLVGLETGWKRTGNKFHNDCSLNLVPCSFQLISSLTKNTATVCFLSE